MLSAQGISASGWDPAHRPNEPLTQADVVNCGYVINVIEDPKERQDVLRSAWNLTRAVLVVSARSTIEADGLRGDECGDGRLTSRQTFQRLFSQAELRTLIDSTIGVESIAAAPGVFLVFRNPEQAQVYLARRTRRRRAAPRVRLSDRLFEEHRAVLEPLMEFVSDRGRLPKDSELADFQGVAEAFGSVPKAFAVIRRVTGTEEWEQKRAEAREDLLIHLALDRLRGASRFSDFPPSTRYDIRGLFGTYKKARETAEDSLFQLSDQEEINHFCRRSTIGKLTPEGLYLHVSALGELSPVLRLYEGCARSLVGEIDDANIVKLHRWKPKVSYLAYPDFEKRAHPALSFAVIVSLRKLAVSYFDFASRPNPPILHRKEEFVTEDDPLRVRFARLTRQEERAGLFDSPQSIGTKNQWEELLQSRGLAVRGHRLIDSRRS